jgi:hypothetical protein
MPGRFWAFARHNLVARGLKGVQLIISGACRGLIESAAVAGRGAMAALNGAFLPECFQPRPGDKGPRREPDAQGHPCAGKPESRQSAEQKAKAIIEGLRASKMGKSADLVERSVHETTTHYAFPNIHRQILRGVKHTKSGAVLVGCVAPNARRLRPLSPAAQSNGCSSRWPQICLAILLGRMESWAR